MDVRIVARIFLDETNYEPHGSVWIREQPGLNRERLA